MIEEIVESRKVTLVDIECGGDQPVEILAATDGSLVVVAERGAITGIPAGRFQVSFGPKDVIEINQTINCGGKEYDRGHAHGLYYRPPFKPVYPITVAYVLGYLAGTAARLGKAWTEAIDGDIVIRRLDTTKAE